METKPKVARSKKEKKYSFPLREQLFKQDVTKMRFIRSLVKTRHIVIECRPLLADVTKPAFSRCLLLLYLVKRYPNLEKGVSSKIGALPKKALTTLLDKLDFSKPEDMHTFHLNLFRVALRDSLAGGKGRVPFWTPEYQVLTKELSPMSGTKSLDSVTNTVGSKGLTYPSFLVTESKLPEGSAKRVYLDHHLAKVSQKYVDDQPQATDMSETYSRSIKISVSATQRSILNEWFGTCNYVYNLAIDKIKLGECTADSSQLRNLLISKRSRTTDHRYTAILKRIKLLTQLSINFDLGYDDDELIIDLQREIAELRLDKLNLPLVVNETIQDWELRTPKQIRYNAIRDLCKAYDTAWSSLAKGRIKHFEIHHREKADCKSIVLDLGMITKVEDGFRILPKILKDHAIFRVHKRSAKKIRDLQICNQVRLVKDSKGFYLNFLFKRKTKPLAHVYNPPLAVGIDPGLRTFMTCVDSVGNMVQINHKNRKSIKAINKTLSELRTRQRVRKKAYSKRERKKASWVDEVHHKVANYLVEKYDMIFYGDIKSHDIVKFGKNRTVNQEFNDLKFYQFKCRLLAKAFRYGKIVIPVPEPYTTKSCSDCGFINEVGSKEIFECARCKLECSRDGNSGKNMLMKGLLTF